MYAAQNEHRPLSHRASRLKICAHTNIAGLVVERPRIGLRSEDRHARLALEEERPLVLRRVPVHLANGARLDSDLGDGDGLGDVEDLWWWASVRVDGARVITRVGEAWGRGTHRRVNDLHRAAVQLCGLHLGKRETEGQGNRSLRALRSGVGVLGDVAGGEDVELCDGFSDDDKRLGLICNTS